MSQDAVDYRHARMLQEMRAAGVTVEDLARAWSSMDGKREHFDRERDQSAMEAETGHYLGYLVETEEIITRATAYAAARKT